MVLFATERINGYAAYLRGDQQNLAGKTIETTSEALLSWLLNGMKEHVVMHDHGDSIVLEFENDLGISVREMTLVAESEAELKQFAAELRENEIVF